MAIALNEVNRLSREQFADRLGWIFECSPWVAERAWDAQPFSTVQQLHEAMVREIERASDGEKLALLRAHPDLAARIRMADASVKEQQGAGLDRLGPKEYEAFASYNSRYKEIFGFPFILAVRGHDKGSILQALKERTGNDKGTEWETALQQVARIAQFRLFDHVIESGEEKSMENDRIMYYGKGDVLVYRTFAAPTRAISAIPESAYTGSDNVIFALNVKVAVAGDEFLPSFTEGDNSKVVATDSMKNFILRHAADFEGDTVEGFLDHISRKLLNTYPQMTSIDITADRKEFLPLDVPGPEGLTRSGLVFRASHNDHATATLAARRTGSGYAIGSLRSGVKDLQLIKVKGSGFAGFVRDEYTTLPETSDRPLFIYLDIHWTYECTEDAIGTASGSYVPAEQVRDIAHTVFHEMNSPSIQHLIYHIGRRILQRFPQLASIRFESNNRTWETVVEEIPGGEGRVYTEPRPPYGFQGFSMTKEPG